MKTHFKMIQIPNLEMRSNSQLFFKKLKLKSRIVKRSKTSTALSADHTIKRKEVLKI